MTPLVMSILIGLLIAVLVFSLTEEETTETATRLSNLKNTRRRNVKSNAKDTIIDDLINQNDDYNNIITKKLLEKVTFTSYIKNQMKLADVRMKIDVFIFLSVVPALFIISLSLFFPSRLYLFLAVACIFVYLPILVLKIKIKKRKAAFLAMFPDSLDLMASSLRAGHSLLTSFQMVVQEMPEPVSTLFKLVSDDVALGRDTKQALEKMTENMPGCIDLRFFVTAVLIQREIGGNLAEILDSLNHTIRERFKLLGQINVQTAQARLSGYILAVAPLGLVGAIFCTNPAYLNPLFHTFLGNVMIGVSIVMAITGFLIIKRITNIRV